jgi:hypothetical protein
VASLSSTGLGRSDCGVTVKAPCFIVPSQIRPVASSKKLNAAIGWRLRADRRELKRNEIVAPAHAASRAGLRADPKAALSIKEHSTDAIVGQAPWIACAMAQRRKMLGPVIEMVETARSRDP